MKNPKLTTICLLAAFLTWFLPAIVFAQVFSDVPPISKFFIPAEYLKGQNLIEGYSDGTFQPDNSVNRAEALAMIFKATGRSVAPENESAENITQENPIQISFPKSTSFTIQNLKTGEKTEFSKIKHLQIGVESGNAKLKILKPSDVKIFDDVSEKDWFYGVAKEAKHLGIVKGYNNGKYFKPGAEINLAEALRMLFQSAEINTIAETSPSPPNIPADAWFSRDIAYAVNHYMLLQQQNGEVVPPDKKLNRGEMATILYRFLQNKANAQFGYASWYADGLAKTKLTVGLEYKEKNLTAAHRDFPFGTILKVTNMNNGKQIEVVVNDRGPFVPGRIIDLSKSAFSALESTSAGVISVRVEQFKAEK